MSAWHVDARGAVALHANRAARAPGHGAARRQRKKRQRREAGAGAGSGAIAAVASEV